MGDLRSLSDADLLALRGKGAATSAPAGIASMSDEELLARRKAAGNETVARGSILPFSRNAAGDVSFDSNAGLVGIAKDVGRAAWDAFTLPGDVYAGKAGEEWLDALAPLGTDDHKPYLETAPWLIAVFAQRRGGADVGEDRKNYYINESVGIAVGFLLLALHHAGLATLTHTPNPMSFLNEKLGRPPTEKPYMLIVAGKPAAGALVPHHALKKKALKDILTVV